VTPDRDHGVAGPGAAPLEPALPRRRNRHVRQDAPAPPADSGATAGARPWAGQVRSCPVRAWTGRWSCGMPTGTRSPSAPSTAR